MQLKGKFESVLSVKSHRETVSITLPRVFYIWIDYGEDIVTIAVFIGHQMFLGTISKCTNMPALQSPHLFPLATHHTATTDAICRPSPIPPFIPIGREKYLYYFSFFALFFSEAIFLGLVGCRRAYLFWALTIGAAVAANLLLICIVPTRRQ